MINIFIHSHSFLENHTRFQTKTGKVYTRLVMACDRQINSTLRNCRMDFISPLLLVQSLRQ